MKYILFLMFWAASLGLAAQNAPEPFVIQAKAVYREDGVRLRWAPLSYEAWKFGNEVGYTVIRKTIAVDGNELPYKDQEASAVTLVGQIKPAPEGEWESLSESNDAAGTAASCLYGDSLDLALPNADMVALSNAMQERDTRFGFGLFAADRDFEVAKMMGLGWADAQADHHKTYLYLITFNHPPNVQVTPARVEINCTDPYELPAPEQLGAQAGDRTILLTWTHNEALYSAYKVMRRPAGGGAWENRTLSPLVYAAETGALGNTAFFQDSLPDNDQYFEYIVYGMSPFELEAGAPLPEPIKGRPAPLSASMAITEVTEATAGQLALQWVFPPDKEANIQYFEVWRAINPDSAYQKISAAPLAPSARNFTDGSPLPVNYYLVKATDEHGYTLETPAFLAQPKDETPPGAPTGLSGVCDRTGLVKLYWRPNPEADVMGYRVFLSNVEAGDYAQVTSLMVNDTAFAHTVNMSTLSEDMFLGVKAYDYRHNASAMTVVKVTRPDLIPPVPPRIEQVAPLPEGVGLEWTLSVSTDAEAHELERQDLGGSQWTRLARFTKNPVLAYTDSSAAPRKRYRYRLLAMDEAGNRASSNIVEGGRFNNGLRAPLTNLTGQQAFHQMIRLDWACPLDEDLTGFVVYRSLTDTLSPRSHAFFPYPLPLQSFSTGAPSAVPGPNGLACIWYDTDTDFNVILRSTYTTGGGTFQNPNQGVPAPAPGGPYVTPTNNHPAAGRPFTVYYWVEAQFADGTTSPIKGPVGVTVQ